MTKKAAAEKPYPLIAVADWGEADQRLRELGLRQIRVANIEGAMNARLIEARAEAERDSAEDRVKIAEIEDGLEHFWVRHRREVEPARSRQLTFGVVGARAAKPAVKLLRGWKLDSVIEAISCGLAQFLRQPKSQLDKDAVLEATPSELALLAKCGVTVETGGERFYAEPDLEKLRAE